MMYRKHSTGPQQWATKQIGFLFTSYTAHYNAMVAIRFS